MQRILITGGAGFIGSNLAASLAATPGCEVVVADNFDSGDWHNLIHVDCELRAVQSNDPALLTEIAAGGFSAILHQAAITDTTVMNQRHMLEVNTNAFGDILAASADSSTRIIYASSAGVYGNAPAPNRIGQGEVPENIYGFSKYAMDRLARRWYDRHTAPIIGLRYFNVYGPGEAHKGKVASMVLQLHRQIKAGNRPRIFKRGEQRRDFIYIRDIVAANLAALKAQQSGVCNIGSGASRSFNDIIDILGQNLGQKLDVDYIDNPYTFFQNHTEADLRETRSLLNWKAAWTLEQGMEEYISFLESGHTGPVLEP